jgi:Ni,Fe-hydrogenase I cytochrome b subunit
VVTSKLLVHQGFSFGVYVFLKLIRNHLYVGTRNDIQHASGVVLVIFNEYKYQHTTLYNSTYFVTYKEIR